MRYAAIVMVLGLLRPALVRADTLAVDAGNEISYDIQKGDTLWDLADDFFDDPFQYVRIWKANPFIKDPHWIYPGQILSIPGTHAAEAAAPAPAEAVPVLAAPPPPPPPAAAPVEAVKPPEPGPVVAAARIVAETAVAAPVPVPLPKVGEKFPKLERTSGLNEDFPPSLAGSEDTMPKRPVAPDWKPLGAIVEEDFLNATDGDTVHITWHEDVNLLPGEVVYVVHNAGDVPNPSGGKPIGVYLQTLAQVRVTKAISNRKSEGLVERARDGVQPGDAVQLGQP